MISHVWINYSIKLFKLASQLSVLKTKRAAFKSPFIVNVIESLRHVWCRSLASSKLNFPLGSRFRNLHRHDWDGRREKSIKMLTKAAELLFCLQNPGRAIRARFSLSSTWMEKFFFDKTIAFVVSHFLYICHLLDGGGQSMWRRRDSCRLLLAT